MNKYDVFNQPYHIGGVEPKLRSGDQKPLRGGPHDHGGSHL